MKEKKVKYITIKELTKKVKPELHIKNYKAPSVLGDENRFFKQELEETKRSLFFS